MDHSLQEERWKRRGHTRKPNFVVRSIYAVADWFGDFGPLLSSTGRGVSHLSALLGHSLLLIVTLVITGLIVLTSALHSLELLEWIGFSGWTAYPILFVVEAIFLTGSIQMDLAFKYGKHFPVRPILGFIAGLIFVLASNIYGLADNIGGLLFGIATPFLLIIAKAMLAWQYTFRSKVATKSIEESEPLSQNQVQELPQTTEITEDEKPVLGTKIDDQNLIDIEPKKDESDPIKKLDLEVEIDDQKPLDIEPENLDLDAPKSDDVSLDIEDEKLTPELNGNLDEQPEKEQPKTIKQEKTSSGRKTRKTKASTGKKKPKKVTADQIDYDAIIEVAKQLIEEHPEKKKPTKYKLAKVAKTTEPNVTEHHAQKALDMMDEKLDVKPIQNLKQNLDIEPDQKLDLEQPKLKRVK